MGQQEGEEQSLETVKINNTSEVNLKQMEKTTK